MPTYQYVCESCGENYEVVQKFTDSTLTIHEPGCGGPVRKKFNAVGVVFKGSGFYRNDSRDSSSSTVKAETGKSDGAPTKSDTASTPSATPAATPSAAPAATPTKAPAPAASSTP